MTEIIKSIIERVTRYEWFTIFMPGIFFVLIGKSCGMTLIEVSGGWGLLFAAAFWGYVFYATGETIIEWVVKKFCPFAPYPEYIEWSKADKVNASMLVCNLNMFRSLAGMVFILIMILLMEALLHFAEEYVWCKKCENKRMMALLIYLSVIFVWSYVKQIKFIKGRISKYIDDKTKASGDIKV